MYICDGKGYVCAQVGRKRQREDKIDFLILEDKMGISKAKAITTLKPDTQNVKSRGVR